jgi:hypothetical protein
MRFATNFSAMFMKFCLVSCLAMVPTETQGQPNQWVATGPGVAHREIRAVVEGDTVHLHALRLDPTRVRLRVVHVYSSLERRPGNYTYSLGEIARRESPLAAVNGGFSGSFSLPSPAGLLVVGGRELTSLNRRDSIQSGILCIQRRTYRVSILNTTEYNSGSCEDAVQAGPRLIQSSGRIGIRPTERRSGTRTARSAICIDRNQNVILVNTGATYLYSLAVVLADSRPGTGLGCSVALNLSGSAESGMVFQTGQQVIWIGSYETPIASAILAVPRRPR